MKAERCIAVLALLVLAAGAAYGGEAEGPPLLQAMQGELARSLQAFADQPLPAYFLSYEITETRSVRVSGSFGTLTRSNQRRQRQLDIDLRVGDHRLDNTHQIRGDRSFFRSRYSYVPIPLEDDPEAVRALLWYHTDARYKQAVERLTRIKTNVQVRIEEEDQSADFSREPAEKYIGELVELSSARAEWEEKVRKFTAPFAAHDDIYQAEAGISAEVVNRWYVNSEGTVVRSSHPFYRLRLSAMAKADDGMELPRFESYLASTPEGLPGDEAVLATVAAMIADLQALREAPVVEPFTGPAILSGRASGVFFHEVFGHRVEGHRQKDESGGQTFKKKIDERILPEGFSVYFDPTTRDYQGTEMAGFYRYDNQGVKARRVTVVEDGILKSFLMSRSPIEGFPRSNGHGRKQAGYPAVTRQSNLLVEVENRVTRDQLTAQLLELVRSQGKPFGLRFEDIQGGFTMTGRVMPNVFNVIPVLVYRVYPDGREELVRGVDLIGTPLAAFSHVVAADDQVGFFNGTCGAESGGVPVGAVSPGVLVSQIEVQKKEKSQDRGPILPAPFTEPGN
ncbi:MAG: hypothetical protein GY856_53300 [bacterium]|nr:hypothetical protein [bacterium]